MYAARGETRQQETINCSASQSALRGAVAPLRMVFKEPVNLRRREIRIQNQAGLLVQPVRITLMFVTEFGCSTILPHDGRRGGLPRCAVPKNYGFALVRQPNGCQVATLDS